MNFNIYLPDNISKPLRILIIIGIVIGINCISYFVTVGIIKLICLCFGFTFSWKYSTGIWLILCLLSLIFKGGKNS